MEVGIRGLIWGEFSGSRGGKKSRKVVVWTIAQLDWAETALQRSHTNNLQVSPTTAARTKELAK